MNPAGGQLEIHNLSRLKSPVVFEADYFCISRKLAQVADAVRSFFNRAVLDQKSLDIFIEVKIYGQLFQKSLNVRHHRICLALACPFRSYQYQFDPREKHLTIVLPVVNRKSVE